VKKLIGKTDIEDALKRLEKLSTDEALTATVQVLEATDSIDNKMEQIVDGAQHILRLVSTANLTVLAERCQGSNAKD
jgi:hypothetical protein